MNEILLDFNELDTSPVVGEAEETPENVDFVISYNGGFKRQAEDFEFKTVFSNVFKKNQITEEGREFTKDLDENEKINVESITSKPEKEIAKKKEIKQRKSKNIKPNEFKLFNPNKNIKYLRSHYNKKYFYRVIIYIGKNIKRKRGSMRDNISKKIKVNFFKNIIASLNWKLRKKNINKDFQRLDQNYITDVTKTYNKYLFEKTLKEIIKEKPKVKDKENAKKKEDKWRQNIKLIEELEESGDEDFKHIFEMNMEELFNEYLDSKEFEESIYDLRRKKFYFDYIQNYIQIAENLVNYYKK